MNEEILIGIIGDLCDSMITCKDCLFGNTLDEHDECEVWRTIVSIRKGRELE